MTSEVWDRSRVAYQFIFRGMDLSMFTGRPTILVGFLLRTRKWHSSVIDKLNSLELRVKAKVLIVENIMPRQIHQVKNQLNELG